MHLTIQAEAHVSPAPGLTERQARTLMQDHWNIHSTARLLTSERDQNFLVASDDGRQLILKVSNPEEDPAVSNLQTAALQTIGHRAPDLPIPHLVPAPGGAVEVTTQLPDGRRALIRVLSCVPGQPLHGQVAIPQACADLGAMAAQMDLALSDMRHPADRHSLIWDMTHLSDLAPLLDYQRGLDQCALVEAEFTRFCTQTRPKLDGFRWQLIHNDLNLHNVFGDGNRITGIIDFGDMLRAPLVVEPAIAATYLMQMSDTPFRLSQAFLKAYHAQITLTGQELALIPELMIGRCLLTTLITRWRAELHPDNAPYILRYADHSRIALQHLVRSREGQEPPLFTPAKA